MAFDRSDASLITETRGPKICLSLGSRSRAPARVSPRASLKCRRRQRRSWLRRFRASSWKRSSRFSGISVRIAPPRMSSVTQRLSKARSWKKPRVATIFGPKTLYARGSNSFFGQTSVRRTGKPLAFPLLKIFTHLYVPSHEVTDAGNESGFVAVVGRLGRKEHHPVFYEVVCGGVRHETLGRRERDALLVAPGVARAAHKARLPE